MPEIIVKLGERVIHRYFFDKDTLSVGRARDNDIVIENLSVSRNHAKIKKEGEKFTLTDMNSANGTLVNGVRVTKADIVDNDQLTVGKHTLLFLNPDAISSQAPAAAPSDKPGAPAISPTATMPGGVKLAGLIGIFTVTKGKQAGQEFRISKSETTIGRAPESDIRLHDWFVSKKHACIYRLGDVYTLKDLDSWRGTTVNGATVKEHTLGENDEVIFGTTVMTFKALEAEVVARMAPLPSAEPPPDSGSDWGADPASGRVAKDPKSTADQRASKETPSPDGGVAVAEAKIESARATPTGTMDFAELQRKAAMTPIDAAAPSSDAVPRDPGTMNDDEFAPMTDEEMAALEGEADSHEESSEEERANRRAAWELAQAEKEFELGKEEFSFAEHHEKLQAEEEAFLSEDSARNGLSQRASSEEISNRQLMKQNAEEEKGLFGGPIPDKEGQSKEVALASPAPATDSGRFRASSSAVPTDPVAREVAMWEKALHNKSAVIRKNAAKELKKLTGKDYDWHSEPGGS